MCLNDETESVGPPPSNLFTGCHIKRRSVMVFFDFLLLLVFELGQNKLSLRFHLRSRDLITVVVILTVRRGFRDSMFPPIPVRS